MKTYSDRMYRIAKRNVIANVFGFAGTFFFLLVMVSGRRVDNNGIITLLMTSAVLLLVSSVVRPKANRFKSIYKRIYSK